MGYQRPLLRLIFDDTMGDLAGFEIVMRRMEIDEIVILGEFAEMEGDIMDPGNREKLSRVLDIMAKHSKSWNMEDEDGEPIPLNRKTLGQQDPALVMAVIGQWMVRATGVSTPLPVPSRDGVKFQEGSIPMTELPLPSLTN